MTEAIIGLVGILIGLFISEFFRRHSRIEDYAKEIFMKRLSVYEELHSKMSEARKTATDIMESNDLSDEDRNAIWSDRVLDVAGFNDANELYVNEEIALHCLMTLIGVDDIYYIEDDEEKQKEKEKFWQNSARTIAMIRNETGLEKIDRYFGSLTKIKHKSEYIDLYQETKKKYNKPGRTS